MAYQNFYATKTQTSIGSSDTSFDVQTPPTALTGRLVLEPRSASQREIISYTGVSGTTLTGVTRGLFGTTAKTHNSGVLIEMNFLAQDYTDLVDAFNSFSSTNGGGWFTVPQLPSTVVYNGNRSYDVTINGVDLTDIYHPGTRVRLTRNTAAPTQSTSLNGTNQYYSKATPAAMTFTDDFVVSAWVKLSSYPTGGGGTIASRYNGTSGWRLYLDTAGRVLVIGHNAGSTNNSYAISAQSVPLNKWVHIAAQLDMSAFTATPTTSYIMTDGVDVPATVARGGTNPTALVQAGDLQIGAGNSTDFFPGKIAQVAVFNSKVTQATMRNYISQSLLGTETSLASAYSFNGVITDLNTTNANNLTANGAAVATNADSPFGGQSNGTISSTLEYGLVHKAVFSTNTTLTVQVPEGNAMPTTGTISASSYSNVKAPYRMPVNEDKWIIGTYIQSNLVNASASGGVIYNLTGAVINVPVGSWKISYSGALLVGGSLSTLSSDAGLSTATSTYSEPYSVSATSYTSVTNTFLEDLVTGDTRVTIQTSTPYYLNCRGRTGTVSAISWSHPTRAVPTLITAENAYL